MVSFPIHEREAAATGREQDRGLLRNKIVLLFVAGLRLAPQRAFGCLAGNGTAFQFRIVSGALEAEVRKCQQSIKEHHGRPSSDDVEVRQTCMRQKLPEPSRLELYSLHF